MKSIYKTIGLSESEYKLLLSLYGIKRIMGFREADKAQPSAMDTFSLYKKGYITNTTGDMEVCGEVSEIFSALLRSDYCVNFESSNIELPTLFFFFSPYDYVVLMEPGSRQGEYIKLSSIMKDSLLEELENRGIVRVSDIGDALIPDSEDEDSPIVSTVAKYTVYTSKECEMVGNISVVQRGVGERICVNEGTAESFYIYTGEKLIAEIVGMVTGNGIG